MRKQAYRDSDARRDFIQGCLAFELPGGSARLNKIASHGFQCFFMTTRGAPRLFHGGDDSFLEPRAVKENIEAALKRELHKASHPLRGRTRPVHDGAQRLIHLTQDIGTNRFADRLLRLKEAIDIGT